MELTFGDRVKNAWNAFLNRESFTNRSEYSYASWTRPDRIRLTRGNERSIVTSVLNRIALDVAAINIKHCRVDDNKRFKEEINSGLNNCLTLEANIDQTARALIQDIVLTMFDEGCVAVVPVDTNVNPLQTNSYDIITLRAGKVTQWYPNSVKVLLYNDRTGNKEEIQLPKERVGIIENPLYAVMNEYNSTLQRLTRKLVLLDSIDEQSGSGKLDLIIQLPYVIKSETRKNQANERRQEIERQLAGSKYGIAYTDGTEKITQLNRPVENNLMNQIEYLTSMLYSQLGITKAILDGTANEETMLNYYSRTIEPIVATISLEFERKFITKTARSQGQTIKYFRDVFKLVPVKELAELADKFTRNEILSSNEVRGIIGYRPSNDPKADQLINSNLNHSSQEIGNMYSTQPINTIPSEKSSNETITSGNNLEELKSQNGIKNPNYQEEVFDSLNEEQKNAVYYMLDQILDDEKNRKGDNP
jgi:phage portal protein|nr:MAG TPA: portal protein [Caudoviricetes sp.]DAW78699.1 MAG TPA: portal protein [Caudoviricetes sp.]